MASLSLSATLPVLAQETTDAPATAAVEEVTVSLSLVGPPGCGSESDLASRIAWRTSRVRIVPAGESERRLEVALGLADGAATATLSLTLPNGRRATRVLRAATCDEAVDAAALVAAVTLDPTASTALTAPDAGAATGGTSGTGGTAPVADASALPSESTGGSAGTAVLPSRSELSGAIFVSGEAVTGPAPDPLLGMGFGVMGVWHRDSVFSPAFRLSLVHFFGQRFEETGGTAFFSLTVGALDVCPIRIGGDTFALAPCATVIGGQLLAEGRQTNDRESHGQPWWVVGGTLILELRPIEPLELQLFGTVGPTLRRDSFQFGCLPGATGCEPNLFHVVSSVSAQGGVSVGLFFR